MQQSFGSGSAAAAFTQQQQYQMNQRYQLAAGYPGGHGKLKIWKPEELKHHFIELLDELWRQPEAEAFHEPVDPVCRCASFVTTRAPCSREFTVHAGVSGNS